MRNRRSGFEVMKRLIGLVRPLSAYMVLAVALGLAGHVCATGITVLGGYGVLNVLGIEMPAQVEEVMPITGATPISGATPRVGESASSGTTISITGATPAASPGGVAPVSAPTSTTPLTGLMSVPLAVLFAAMGIAAVLRGALRYGEQALNHFIAFTLLALIRDRVFQALRRLAPAKLEGRNRGDLISLITSDIELLEVFYAHTISPAAIALIFSVLLTAYIGSFHFMLGAIAATAYAVVGVAMPLVASRMSGEAGLRYRNASGTMSGFVLDSLRGLDELLQFGQGAKRLAAMNSLDSDLARDERTLKRVTGRNMAFTNSVILLFDAVMLFAATWLNMRGELGFEGVVLPVLALMGSFGPVVALANLGSTLQNTFAAGNRVLDLLDEVPQTADVTGRPSVGFDGAAASDVSFTYGFGSYVLRDVSLQVHPGEIVGVAGKSGSGKSTLLRLFMRFWEPQCGAVEVSGVNANRVNTDNLRDLESFVEQDTQLFHDTIRNNVAVAKLDATDEEIEAACRKASIHDFILGLPEGYNTQVGELGDTLSGGERQRLGLARAFLHDAPFMLLDEPTSNLDSLNEGVILRALQRERDNKAVLLVSHRASTMRVADRVVNMSQGRMC